MGRAVIVCYTPKQGKEQALHEAVRKHLHVLRDQNLVTEQPAYVMRAANGAIVEVFEWRSAQAIEAAHSNPAVLALWDEFNAACEYTPLAKLAETQHMFAEFDTLAL